MIRPEGFRGAAFGTAAAGDGKADAAARAAIARILGISADWAMTHQVHGTTVVAADGPGDLGDADALYTHRPGLPVAVTTADCVPVILEAADAVAVVHAGWRGAAGRVVSAARAALAAAGSPAIRGAVGPAIGPCCYEVGPEVLARFPGGAATTTWGTPSLDLPAVVTGELEGLDVWRSAECTACSDGYHSHRRDGTRERQVAVAWLPSA